MLLLYMSDKPKKPAKYSFGRHLQKQPADPQIQPPIKKKHVLAQIN